MKFAEVFLIEVACCNGGNRGREREEEERKKLKGKSVFAYLNTTLVVQIGCTERITRSIVEYTSP